MNSKEKEIVENVTMEKKIMVIRDKDLFTMMDDLFHKLISSEVSLEGYASILNNEYADRLDIKGKHYIKRIKSNMKEIEWLTRMLQECINGMK